VHAVADEHRGLPFLKRRYARAIESGDDETASRLRVELDLLMNGALARPGAGGGADGPPCPAKRVEAGEGDGDEGEGAPEADLCPEAEATPRLRRSPCTPLLENTDWFVLREC
jgi:hypothetical protein